jgi:hypothetical protein
LKADEGTLVRGGSRLEESMHERPQRFCALAVVLALAGCSSIGPPTIKRDRSDYSSAMANSWKELQLLNIVKYRYFDPPVFLDVPSVISQQELEARAQATAQLFNQQLTNVSGTQDFYNLEARGRYIDRPTISYSPISGRPFVDLFLRPIPPATILTLIDAGYPASFIGYRTVESINGIYNYSLASTHGHPEDRRFPELIEVIGRLQQARAIAARTTVEDDDKDDDKDNDKDRDKEKLPKPPVANQPPSTTAPAENAPVVTTVYFSRHVSPAVERDIRLMKSLLGLDPQRDEFRVTGGPRHTPEEIAVTTRSMQLILEEFASGVDVPEQDVVAGRATSVPALAQSPDTPPLIHIHSGPEPTDDAYAAVYYQHCWFWIDNDDLRSKLDFIFLMVFYSLSESRSVPQAPLVTISAGQ